MIKITNENNNFIIKGTLDLGYVGTYTNDDLVKEIKIEYTYDEILDDLNNRTVDNNSWHFLNQNLKDNTIESISTAIELFFNEQENEIKKNPSIINNQLIGCLWNDLIDYDIEFWNIEEITSKELLQSNVDFTYNVDSFHEALINQKNGISLEESFKLEFPMFDYNTLFSNLVNKVLCLSGSSMVFQFDDCYDEQIFSYAYAEILIDFQFDDWNNF